MAQHLQRSLMPTFPTTASLGGTPGAGSVNAEAWIAHLLEVGQVLHGQGSGVGSRLRQEVAAITQGRAQLLLRHHAFQDTDRILQSAVAIQFLVQLDGHVYGALCVGPHPDQPACPGLSLTTAHLLAQVCSWLLYALEQSAFLKAQTQHLDFLSLENLTAREREVLSLMGMGRNEQQIADILTISRATVEKHQQHIYEKLGAHSRHEALLIAYHAHLLPLIADIDEDSASQSPSW